MPNPEITVSENQNVIHIRFDRAEKYNAISMEMLEGLRDATAR